MAKRSGRDAKQDALRLRGALNPHPERVRDPLFTSDEIFDPRDLVQVKYEMIRRARVDKHVVKEVCQAFGVSRPVFYKSEQALEREGLTGLVAKKRGPRGAHKLTAAAMKVLDAELARNDSLDSKALSRLLKSRLQLVVHPRSVERALARRQKKTAGPNRKA